MRTTDTATHYETIGAPATADAAALRRAYIARARLLHPDRYGDAPPAERARAERRMQELNAAWSVLSDPDARRAYDRSLIARVRPTGPVASGGRTATVAAPPRRPVRRPPTVATEQEMEIRGFARLVRPLPLFVLAVLFVGAVVVAAIAGGGGGGGDRGGGGGGGGTAVRVPAGIPLGCIDLVPRATAVPCGTHEAVVWEIVDGGEECPAGLEPIYRDGVGGLFCVTLVE